MQLTSHLTDATLAAALDRDDAARDVARLHVIECESCRTVLEQAREQDAEVGRLLQSLDHSPPAIDAAEFVRRIASRGNTRNRTIASRRLWGHHAARWTVAATILTASVAAAALVPNSPVRRLLGLVAAASSISHGHSRPAPSVSVAAQSRSRGVEILPHGRAEVRFRSSQAAGVVRVISATTAQLSVEGDGDGPTYTVGENMILVNNRPADSISYIVAIPALTDTDAVYIRTPGGVAYSNVGNRVTVRRAVDASGQIRLPLQEPKR